MREQKTPCINASRAQTLRGLHQTYNDNRVCDSCLVAATHAATSDRVVTATRSATGNDTGSSSALLPLPVAFSLPDRHAAGLDAPAAPLRPSQVQP